MRFIQESEVYKPLCTARSGKMKRREVDERVKVKNYRKIYQ